VWLRLSWMWIAFFTGVGLLNLYVAYSFSEDTWVNFKLFGILGITFAFVIGQAFYLARYVKEDAVSGAPDGSVENESSSAKLANRVREQEGKS
jgi:intracellular septation protein A